MKKFNFFEKILHKVIYFYSYPKYLFIKTEEFFIKKALIRKENSNFLFNFIKDNTNYLPSSNIQISSLIASRARKIVDKNGNNRIKPHRWIMINNKIKKIIKNYKVSFKNCLNLGAGVQNPYALPLIWYFNGALSVDVIEPGKIDKISSITGIQELIFNLEFDDVLYFGKKKKKKITKSIESRYYKPKKFINWRKSKYNYQQKYN